MRYVLPVACALAAALPARAALDDKYLPDDADAVAVVNVKQALASDLFAKNFKKQAVDALALEPVAAVLKDLGFDPLKDVDRVAFVKTHGFVPKTEFSSFIVLVEGRFDAGKLLAAAEKAIKDNPKLMKIHARGDARIVELTVPGANSFAAVLDPGHVVVAQTQADVAEALDKAAGKKKTALRNKGLASLLAKFKDGDGLTIVASGDTISSEWANAEPGKPKVFMVRTLADEGIVSALISAQIDAEATFTMTLTARDKDAAARAAKGTEEWFMQRADETEKQKLPALAKALKGIRATVKGEVATVEGKGDAEAVQQLVVGLFRSIPGTGPTTTPPKTPTDKRDK
jgi:hypothetical protein